MKKKLLIVLAASIAGLFCLVGILFFPLLLIIGQDIVGSFINPPFAMCKLMDEQGLETALAKGLDLKAGCCVENMIGECSIARPNSTLLVYAARQGDLAGVRRLVERGEPVNQEFQDGYPLTAAAERGDTPMVEYLLSHGADFKSKYEAIFMAAHYRQSEAVKAVLRSIEPEHRQKVCDETACRLFTELYQPGNPLPEYRALILYLIENCADPNALCASERFLAALGRNDENVPLIKALLARGGNLDAKMPNGKSVRQYLRSFNDYDSRPAMREIIEGEER